MGRCMSVHMPVQGHKTKKSNDTGQDVADSSKMLAKPI